MMVRPASRKIRIVTLVSAFVSAVLPALAQQGMGGEINWPPTSDALEFCIIEEEKSYATGHACIGKYARKCLEIAQREPIVHVERCYEPELAAWARLVKRHFDQRPKGAKAQRIAEVQRLWLAYRERKCGYVDFHHGGGDLGRSESLICLMEETARRAIELRRFQTKG